MADVNQVSKVGVLKSISLANAQAQEIELHAKSYNELLVQLQESTFISEMNKTIRGIV